MIAELTGDPHSSTVRTQLVFLKRRDTSVTRSMECFTFISRCSAPCRAADALRHMIETFFEGSAEKMMAALLGGGPKMTEEELGRLSKLIDKAKKGGPK